MCTKKVFESSCLQEALDAYTVRSEEKDEESAEEWDPRNPQYPPMDYSRIKRKTLTKDDLELAAIAAEFRNFYRTSPYYMHAEDDRTTAREKDEEHTLTWKEREAKKRTREE